MKEIVLGIGIWSTVVFGCFGQPQVSDTIQISFLYEVSLIFDEPVCGEARLGSPLIAHQTKTDQHTIKLLANGQQMADKKVSRLPNTNLTVRTARRLYNFILTYKKEPDRLVITPEMFHPVFVFEEEVSKKDKKTNSIPGEYHAKDGYGGADVEAVNKEKLIHLLRKLDKENQNLFTLAQQDNKFKMRIGITNIWVDEENLYFKILVGNFSSIPYDINYFRYVTTYGKWNLKRNSDPIEDKQPRASLRENISVIKPGASYLNVVAVRKFTLNKGEYFNIQVGEENGARQIFISVSRKNLFEAIPLDF